MLSPHPRFAYVATSPHLRSGHGTRKVRVEHWSDRMPLKDLMTVVKSHRVAVLLAAFAVGVGLWLLLRLLLGPTVAVDTVQQKDIIQSVVASGHVETPHRVTIGTQIVGTVRQVRVEEGQTVDAHQVLIELDNAELQATAEQAEMAVEAAQARLRQVREVQAPVAEQALRQAEVTRSNARAQLLRNTDLFKQGYIGQATLDEAQKAADLAEAQLQSAQKQFESAKTSGSDYAMATTALAQARASEAAAVSRLRYATIVAPVAGTLISRAVESGYVVQPGNALMVLSPTGDTQLVVQIDEKNLRLLAIGQDAQASADAYPDQRFDARLVYINPGVDVQRGSVEVKLAVPHPPPYLTQDMTVSVDIRVATRSNAVLIASDDVHDISTPQPWVLKVNGGRAHRQVVRLGLRSAGMSEVLEGLKPKDLVVPATVQGVHDGSRIRATARIASH
jgi:HlyD family secretion protein